MRGNLIPEISILVVMRTLKGTDVRLVVAFPLLLITFSSCLDQRRLHKSEVLSMEIGYQILIPFV